MEHRAVQKAEKLFIADLRFGFDGSVGGRSKVTFQTRRETLLSAQVRINAFGDGISLLPIQELRKPTLVDSSQVCELGLGQLPFPQEVFQVYLYTHGFYLLNSKLIGKTNFHSENDK